MFFDVTTVLSQVRAGKIKALAVTGRARTSLAPDLPTLAESGLPDYEMSSWYGLLGPAGLSVEIRAQLHADAARVLAQPDIRAKLLGIGFEPVGNSPQEFSAYIQSESARWAGLVRSAHISTSQ